LVDAGVEIRGAAGPSRPARAARLRNPRAARLGRGREEGAGRPCHHPSRGTCRAFAFVRMIGARARMSTPGGRCSRPPVARPAKAPRAGRGGGWGVVSGSTREQVVPRGLISATMAKISWHGTWPEPAATGARATLQQPGAPQSAHRPDGQHLLCQPGIRSGGWRRQLGRIREEARARDLGLSRPVVTAAGPGCRSRSSRFLEHGLEARDRSCGPPGLCPPAPASTDRPWHGAAGRGRVPSSRNIPGPGGDATRGPEIVRRGHGFVLPALFRAREPRKRILPGTRG